ncbi:hypothetical protein A2U01_0109494, partial [Trifolium medium]|nr:hypothetical protein [Trifolium medium]
RAAQLTEENRNNSHTAARSAGRMSLLRAAQPTEQNQQHSTLTARSVGARSCRKMQFQCKSLTNLKMT